MTEAPRNKGSLGGKKAPFIHLEIHREAKRLIDD